ncbi:VOC family protein [Cerasicoccus fimbriatus]|uniref:VOC family protein n=1 Tax=Cerasicoccus fimbriatus TaxID=3014554 RepID=UPI0022B3E5AC|nr:VOC family protein [Cerasicoccus sp. TK19100]
MPSIVQPYVFFNGRCDEALKFYEAAIDAKIDYVMRFNESPEPVPAEQVPADFDDKIMHCSFKVGDCVIMASDGCEEGVDFKGFSLSITVEDKATAHRYFNALAEGGKVEMPMGKTFWSPCFGMVTDQFGMSWMIGLAGEM